MASGGGSLEILTTTYQQVISDVVKNMKEEYLNEGADIEMLEQLKTLWLTKLSQSGAVNRPARAEPPPRSIPSHTQLSELASVAPQQPLPSGPVPSPTPVAPSKTMTGVSPSPLMTSSSGGVVSGTSSGSHLQHRASASGSIGKTISQSPSRPPPALLHIPETTSAPPPQSRVQANSGTSSVIQQAPPRSQQATPTTITESASAATATAQQLVTTPIAAPSVMFHPNILAAAALQQQANQSASSNPGAPAAAILTPSSAPSVMEALQQQLALGGGASVATSGATATPAVNPFGAALNLMNPAAGGMVPVQTAQGTMLIPLQAYLTLQQLKQQQLAAVVAASASGGEASSSDEAGSSNEVHQIDGLPPVLDAVQGSSHQVTENDGGCEGGIENDSAVDLIDGSSPIFDRAKASSYLKGGMCRGESGVVCQNEGLVLDLPTLSAHCGDSLINKDSPVISSVDDERMNLETSSAVSKERDQNTSSLEPHMSMVRSKCKPSSDRSQLELDGANFLPNLQTSKSQSHKKNKKKSGKAVIFPHAEVIVQLDGLTGGGGQGSKVIVQLDGNGSSSEEDSDADDDSSEDEEEATGVAGGAVAENDEEPLNSADDVSDGDSDEEGGGDFETEDTIVCQWEKVYRVKNKWKFQLKDGVMHIGGFDYVFHKTNGEADW